MPSVFHLQAALFSSLVEFARFFASKRVGRAPHVNRLNAVDGRVRCDALDCAMFKRMNKTRFYSLPCPGNYRHNGPHRKSEPDLESPLQGREEPFRFQ